MLVFLLFCLFLSFVSASKLIASFDYVRLFFDAECFFFEMTFVVKVDFLNLILIDGRAAYGTQKLFVTND